MEISVAVYINIRHEHKKKMDKYGWSKEDLALVAEKNSYNGSLNPYAQFKKPFSKEEVLASKMIADYIIYVNKYRGVLLSIDNNENNDFLISRHYM